MWPITILKRVLVPPPRFLLQVPDMGRTHTHGEDLPEPRFALAPAAFEGA
jgi:hypothetical protein